MCVAGEGLGKPGMYCLHGFVLAALNYEVLRSTMRETQEDQVGLETIKCR